MSTPAAKKQKITPKAGKSPAQLFPRVHMKNGLRYENSSDQTFALACLTVGFDLVGFDGFLEDTAWAHPQAKANLRWLIKRRSQAMEAAKNNDQKLVFAILETLQIARQLVETDDAIRPLAQLGSRFKQGRKPGVKGPLRRALESLVKSEPKVPAAKAWQILREKRPSQMEFTGSRPELREVWLKGKKLAEWPHFQKLLSQVKKDFR